MWCHRIYPLWYHLHQPSRQWPEVSDFVTRFCTLRDSKNLRPVGVAITIRLKQIWWARLCNILALAVLDVEISPQCILPGFPGFPTLHCYCATPWMLLLFWQAGQSTVGGSGSRTGSGPCRVILIWSTPSTKGSCASNSLRTAWRRRRRARRCWLGAARRPSSETNSTT